MNSKYFYRFFLLIAPMSLYAQKMKLDVVLNPMGSFSAESTELKGTVVNHIKSKNGAQYTAENLSVKIDTFKTGIDYRDTHFKEKLESSKFPEFKVIKATGSKDGKGTAEVEVHGVKKTVPFTFKPNEKSKIIEFEMDVSIKDYGIGPFSYKGVGVEDKVHVSGEVPSKNE